MWEREHLAGDPSSQAQAGLQEGPGEPGGSRAGAAGEAGRAGA